MSAPVSPASAGPPGRKNHFIFMIKSFVYVLRCSDSTFYIGSTRNLIKRLQAHKNGKVKTTKNRRPIKLFYKEELLTYTEARKRELYLKSGAGRDWLKSKIWRSGRVVEGAALEKQYP